MKTSVSKTGVLLFVTGVGVGAAAGLLLAPWSGERMRRFLGRKAEKGKDYVTLKARQARRQAMEFLEKGKGALAESTEQLGDAVESGKRAYRARFAM